MKLFQSASNSKKMWNITRLVPGASLWKAIGSGEALNFFLPELSPLDDFHSALIPWFSLLNESQNIIGYLRKPWQRPLKD